jgi:hypothetical protein
VIGFSDSVEKPIILGKNLLQEVRKYNQTKKGKEKLLLRIGIESGPVYVIKDLVTKKNAFWGPGIIMTKRIMDIGKENHMITSKKIAEDLMKLSKDYKSLFHLIGKYKIKHNEKIEVYNVYDKDFGNKEYPRPGKEIDKKETDSDLRPPSNFKFKKIELILNVTNPKNLMTAHSFVWDLVNISKKTQTQILYRLAGEVKKEFSELNVKVNDKSGQNLEIVRIDANKPLYKEFFVKLKKPIKPRQQIQNLTLNFDWEEPDREYVYVLPTDCKVFIFKLTVPNSINPRIRLFKRVGLSEKKVLEPKITPGKKNIEVIWEGKNLHANDEYIFQW